MVQAPLASMRHYCPGTPICLVVDGDVDVRDLEEDYGVLVLRTSTLADPLMRRTLSGNYRAKLAALWEGPFERYVWLDSDAIVWGNFLPLLSQDADFEIFWEETPWPNGSEQVPSWLPRYYFDPQLLKRFDPHFQWHGRSYFSSGAFAVRRNAIPFSAWIQAERWLEQCPGLFAWGEMGILNYLVHALRDAKRLRVAQANLQHIWGHEGIDELAADCEASGWRFPKGITRPRVAHFCGRKPFTFDFRAYSRPFTIARLEHHRRRSGTLGAWWKIAMEDGRVLQKRVIRRVERLIRKS